MEESIKAKRLTQQNWLEHLDEMTDEEISYMMDTSPRAKQFAEDRKASPKATDRSIAEDYRDFGY